MEQRRLVLGRILGGHQPPRIVSTALTGKVDQLLTAACRAGFEGPVGKRAGSPYRSGRGLDWSKVGTGFDQRSRSELGKRLEERHADVPTVTGVPRLGD